MYEREKKLSRPEIYNKNFLKELEVAKTNYLQKKFYTLQMTLN